MSDRSDMCGILKIPDHIVMKIVLNLNARERVALGRTCKALSSFVFQEEKLLRNLDFSENGFLTTPSDVNKYFCDKKAVKYITKLDVSGMYCPKCTEGLMRNISKASNLIEVNITGFKFETFKQFGEFLAPLKKLKKLSSSWPIDPQNHMQYNKYLAEPFGKLTHLSLTSYVAKNKWPIIRILEMCRQLEEFRWLMAYDEPESRRGTFWMQPMSQLPKLRLVACYGVEAGLFETIVSEDLLPDRDRWAKSYPYDPSSTLNLYFEKDLEVSDEFIEEVRITRDSFNHNMRGWYLWHQRLLYEVVATTHPWGDRVHCFLRRASPFSSCAMRIEDAKSLLKNPQHQITQLSCRHEIEPDCDVHLIAMVFPKLTKLDLCKLIMRSDPTWKSSLTLETGTKRKHPDAEKSSDTPEENVAFKKLVENTPNLKDFTLYARRITSPFKPHPEHKNWDIGALYFIASWTNLQTLWLANVPITDGDFLIEIGKGCKSLEKIRLENLGVPLACCYKDGLLKMLPHCVNLKDFSIQQNNVDKIDEIFEALANVPKLRRVRVESLGRKRKIVKLVPAIEKLILSCNLILLVCEVKGFNEVIVGELEATMLRLKKELKRFNFEFQILWWKDNKKPERNFDLEFAHRDLLLPYEINDAIFRFGLC